VGFARRSRASNDLLRFGLRLGLSLLLAFAAAGAVTFAMVSREIGQQRLERDLDANIAEVHALEASATDSAEARAAGPRRTKRSVWLPEVAERLELLQARPGTIEAILIDRRFRIVAAGDPSMVGKPDRTERVAQVFRERKAWNGGEAGSGRDREDLEFLFPVELPDGSYVFEITTDGQFVARELSAVRRDLMIGGTVAWLIAALLFWLTAGRRLVRSHGSALRRATRDGLTNLANHRAFQDDLHRATALAARQGDPLGLVLFDLDAFKLANDAHGHNHGDEQLRTVARVLGDGRAGDQPFRLGGDEFALLLPHTDSAGARHAACRIRTRLEEQGVRVSAGAGELRPGRAPADFREEVDAALYEAKRRGGNQVVCFEEVASEISPITARRIAALESLLAERALDIAFQPIWDLANGALIGVEALARPHERLGFNGPADAFDVAQQLSRLPELDALCVDTVMARADELPPGALLFVNVTPQALYAHTSGVSWLVEAVAAAGVDPGRVVVEVTERVGGRLDLVVRGLRALQDHGFRVAIDDVGVGNSGLELLRQTEPDYIKIDRSVVAAAVADRNARGIVLAMATFGQQTGAFVIAEGIEDEETLQALSELGTDTEPPAIAGGQGYGLGRPTEQMPQVAWLKTNVVRDTVGVA
jgi:diguanylate cyclase (GGDEF)-like protein